LKILDNVQRAIVSEGLLDPFTNFVESRPSAPFALQSINSTDNVSDDIRTYTSVRKIVGKTITLVTMNG